MVEYRDDQAISGNSGYEISSYQVMFYVKIKKIFHQFWNKLSRGSEPE